MRFTIRTLLLVMLLVGVSVTVYHNSEYYKRWKRVEASIATFDPHQTSHEITDYYRQLFTLADDDLLPWMLRHENDSVAIQSAWETVELSVPVVDGKGTYKPRYPDGTTSLTGRCRIERTDSEVYPLIDDLADVISCTPTGTVAARVTEGSGKAILFYPNGNKNWEMTYEGFNRTGCLHLTKTEGDVPLVVKTR